MKHKFILELNDECGIEDVAVAKDLIEDVINTGCLNVLPRNEIDSLKFQERFKGCKRLSFELTHMIREVN